MKQQAFEQKHADRWRRFEALVARLDEFAPHRRLAKKKQPAYDPSVGFDPGRGGTTAPAAEQADDFPERYREICRDLSLASQRRYSPQLLDRLNALALGGHRHLYRRETDFFQSFLRYVTSGFPVAVRREWLPIGVATAIFLVPALVLFWLVLAQPELIYSMMSPEQVSEFEFMYDPQSDRIGTNREAETDVRMFGYYIANNIGVAFRTFASGLVWGLGSIFFLLLNGLLLGGLSAHILQLGYDETFFSFVIGHGSFELTAIVIAGGAGLKLGYALIAPGRRSRVDSLRRAARESMQLIYGVIAMLVIAALFEAFWSSKQTIVAEIKFAVGAVLWGLVFVYFTFVGRAGEAR